MSMLLATYLSTFALSTPAASAAGDDTTVRLSIPRYDSPGARVTVLVSALDVPEGAAVTLSASPTSGSITCTSLVWHNPVAESYSRKCYLTLPSKATTVTVTGTAVLTRDGAEDITRQSIRSVRANGYASGTPTLAQIADIERCHNTTDYVQLTFDDGASSADLSSILATLKKNDVRATFFFLGKWKSAHPRLYKKIKAAGHRIGNHSHSHPALSRLSKKSVVWQIHHGTAGTGTPKLLRPPFAAGAFSRRLIDIAADEGYSVCRWTTDTYDWDGPSAATMIGRVRYGDYLSAPISAGGVILMHGTGAHTAEALQGIIDAVRDRGLELQPLS